MFLIAKTLGRLGNFQNNLQRIRNDYEICWVGTRHRCNLLFILMIQKRISSTETVEFWKERQRERETDRQTEREHIRKEDWRISYQLEWVTGLHIRQNDQQYEVCSNSIRNAIVVVVHCVGCVCIQFWHVRTCLSNSWLKLQVAALAQLAAVGRGSNTCVYVIAIFTMCGSSEQRICIEFMWRCEVF